jgi:type I restriction enzyme R subunit
LQAYYEQPFAQRPTLSDIRALAEAIKSPPMSFTPERLWEAYRAVDERRVRGEGGKVLADVVSLVRFAVGRDDELTPHADQIRLRFDLWLEEQDQGGRNFNATQRGWLLMVRDHVATSLSIETADFDLDPFAQEGGLAAAYQVFGGELTPLLAELNETLAA